MSYSNDWGDDVTDSTAKKSNDNLKSSNDNWGWDDSPSVNATKQTITNSNNDDWGWGDSSTPSNNSTHNQWDSKNNVNGSNNLRSFGRGRQNFQRRNDYSNDFGNRNSDNYQRDEQRNFSSDKTTMKIPSSDVGRVIGKGGSTIKDLQARSGARIKVDNQNSDYDTSVFIFGSDEQRSKAEELINEVIGQTRPSKQQRTSFDDFNRTTNNDANKDDNKVDDIGFIDWQSAVEECNIATRLKWESLAPVKKEFYFEDPEVSAMHPQDVKDFRLKNNNIMVSCFNEEDNRPIPNPILEFYQAFSHFPEVMDEINKVGFKQPSPIQSQSWPILLQGFDLIGIAQTGTGKTLAYLLPALIHIDQQPTPREKRVGPTALIMAPTRELAQQIERECKKYNYKGIKALCIYGGGDRRAQIGSVGKGVEIVIATPGRLNDLCMNKHIDLTSVSYLVLDEADRMLDMGFEPQIKKVMIDIRPERQTVMMSATWPDGVQRLAVTYMKDPMQIFVGTLNLAACHSVEQNILLIQQEEKRPILYDFVENMKPEDKVIVFVMKKAMADELSSEFALKSINCQAIHGDRDQSDREQALEDLRTGAARILIATDVAARGLDIEDITHILNYDFPRNIEEYVHRIGRTGRAGRQGQSITLMTREDWKHAGELIPILVEADQVVPPGLVAMSERYKEWKAKRDAELEMYGSKPRRGGFGGGRNNKW